MAAGQRGPDVRVRLCLGFRLDARQSRRRRAIVASTQAGEVTAIIEYREMEQAR